MLHSALPSVGVPFTMRHRGTGAPHRSHPRTHNGSHAMLRERLSRHLPERRAIRTLPKPQPHRERKMGDESTNGFFWDSQIPILSHFAPHELHCRPRADQLAVNSAPKGTGYRSLSKPTTRQYRSVGQVLPAPGTPPAPLLRTVLRSWDPSSSSSHPAPRGADRRGNRSRLPPPLHPGYCRGPSHRSQPR